MTGYNLPPGVTEDMLPGNTLEDRAWDDFRDEVERDCQNYLLSAQQATELWRYAMEDTKQRARWSHNDKEAGR